MGAFRVIRRVEFENNNPTPPQECVLAGDYASYGEAREYAKGILDTYFNDDIIMDPESFELYMNSACGIHGYKCKFVGICSNACDTFLEVTCKVCIDDVYHLMKYTIFIERTDCIMIRNFIRINVILDDNAICPTRAYPDDAGMDLYTPEAFSIPARGRAIVNTGVHVDIPAGYAGNLESKSGLMRNKGIRSEGTIDAGYHGTIQAVLFNDSDETVEFAQRSKITQLVIRPIATPEIKIVSKFNTKSDRGSNGFGSTGK